MKLNNKGLDNLLWLRDRVIPWIEKNHKPLRFQAFTSYQGGEICAHCLAGWMPFAPEGIERGLVSRAGDPIYSEANDYAVFTSLAAFFGLHRISSPKTREQAMWLMGEIFSGMNTTLKWRKHALDELIELVAGAPVWPIKPRSAPKAGVGIESREIAEVGA